MNEVICGRSLKYGDNINTDIISPPAYMELSIEDAAQYAMSPVDELFAQTCQLGDIFVAQKNLGSGSSRETAPLTLKTLGIRTIIAQSYARIFYRNCINLGILALESPDTHRIQQFDELMIDVEQGIIINKTRDESYPCLPLPKHIQKMARNGGLVACLQQGIDIGR